MAPSPDEKRRLEEMTREAARRYGVPEEFLHSIIAQESNFDPLATNPNSSAAGLAMLTDATAHSLGVTNKFDPAQASDAAARLTAQHLSMFNGSLPKAAAAYMAGAPAVLNASTKDGLPDGTDGNITYRDYTRQVMARMQGVTLDGSSALTTGIDVPDFSSLPQIARETLAQAIQKAHDSGIPPEAVAQYLRDNETSIRQGGNDMLLNQLPWYVKAPGAIADFAASMVEPNLQNMLAFPASFFTGPATRSLVTGALESKGIARLAVRFLSEPGVIQEIANTAANRTELAGLEAAGKILSIAEEPSLLARLSEGFGVGLPFATLDAVDAANDTDGRTPAGAFAHSMAFFMGFEALASMGGAGMRMLARRYGYRTALRLANELKAAGVPERTDAAILSGERGAVRAEDQIVEHATEFGTHTPEAAQPALDRQASVGRGRRIFTRKLKGVSPWVRDSSGTNLSLTKAGKALSPEELDDVNAFIREENRRARFDAQPTGVEAQPPAQPGTALDVVRPELQPRTPAPSERETVPVAREDFSGTLDAKVRAATRRVNRLLSLDNRVYLRDPVSNATFDVRRATRDGIEDTTGKVHRWVDFFNGDTEIASQVRRPTEYPARPALARPPETPGVVAPPPQRAPMPVPDAVPAGERAQWRVETILEYDADGKLKRRVRGFLDPPLRDRMRAILARDLTDAESLALVDGRAGDLVRGLKQGFIDRVKGKGDNAVIEHIPITKSVVEKELKAATRKPRPTGGSEITFGPLDFAAPPGSEAPPPGLPAVANAAKAATESFAPAEREAIAQIVEAGQKTGVLSAENPVQRTLAEATLDGAGRPVADPLPRDLPTASPNAASAQPGAKAVAEHALGEEVPTAAKTVPAPASEGEAALIASIDQEAATRLVQRRAKAEHDIAAVESDIAALQSSVDDLKGAGGKIANDMRKKLASAKNDLAARRAALEAMKPTTTSATKTDAAMAGLPPETRDRLNREAPPEHIDQVVTPVVGAKPGAHYVIVKQLISKRARGRGAATLEAKSVIAEVTRNDADELVLNYHSTVNATGTTAGARKGVSGYQLTGDSLPGASRLYEAQEVKLYYSRIGERIPKDKQQLEFVDRDITEALRRTRKTSRPQAGVRDLHGPRPAAHKEREVASKSGSMEDATLTATTPEAPKTPEEILMEKEAAERDLAARVWNAHSAPQEVADAAEAISGAPPGPTHATAAEAGDTLAKSWTILNRPLSAAEGVSEAFERAQDRFLTAIEDLKTHAGSHRLLFDLDAEPGTNAYVLNIRHADTKDLLLSTKSPVEAGEFIDSFEPSKYTPRTNEAGGRVGGYQKDGCG